MRQLRRYGRIAVLLALLFWIAGCALGGGAAGEKQHGKEAPKVLRVAFTREPGTLDPAKIRTLEERLLVQALYARLVAYDPEGKKPVPALAERWERSPDGLVYTFHLRRAKFFGGRPITAEDVKYALSRLASPAVASPWADLLANVVGAAAYAQGAATEIEGIRVLDSFTVQIALLKPQDDFLLSLTHPAAAVVDRLLVEATGTNFGRSGTLASSLVSAGGSGPFGAVEWVKGRFLTLEANPNYYAGRPELGRLEVYFEEPEDAYIDFLSGRVELAVGLDAAHLAESQEDSYLAGRRRLFPLEGAIFLAWPQEAMPSTLAGAAASLDRAALAEGFGGLVEPSSLPPGPATPPFVSGEPVRPGQSLELLYPEDGLGLWLLASDTRLLAERVARQLANASGLAVRAKAVPAPAVVGPVLAANIAPYAGAGWRWPSAGSEETVLPLLRPSLAVLVGERLDGFSVSPFGDLDWAKLRLLPHS